MPRFQGLRVSGGRRDQRVSVKLGRHRSAFPRADSADFGAGRAASSDSAAIYAASTEETSTYSRKGMAKSSLHGRSIVDSETASASVSQRSTCSPSSLYSLSSPCLDQQPRQRRENVAGPSERAVPRPATDSGTGEPTRQGERSETEREDVAPYSFTTAEVRRLPPTLVNVPPF